MSELSKMHSAVRWGKPVEELEGLVEAGKAALGVDIINEADAQNGNRAIHLAAQNGHLNVVRWLVCDKKCDVNLQNNKGQTALHMSVAYDFMHCSKILLDNGADGTLKNADGNAAINGIDGDKVDGEAWNSPLNHLRAVYDEASMREAFEQLEKAVGAGVALDKGSVVQCGMMKKNNKEIKPFWDQAKFMEIAKKI